MSDLAMQFMDEPTPYMARGEPYKLAMADRERGVFLYHGNCLDVMEAILKKHPNGCFDMIFADPPYGLSNDGITCVAGKMTSVNKGQWDKFASFQDYIDFTREWLGLCQKLLTKNGTIWVSGTRHNIYSVGHIMAELGFKVLNDIVWEKPNPPPNLSCRYFTHSTEIILWAAKNEKSRHVYNYQDMKAENGGKQMKSVWKIAPPSNQEKLLGKHPTQKPTQLLSRIIESSTSAGDLVFDPFSGSSTTGVSALNCGRFFCGVEADDSFISLSKRRLEATIYGT